MTEAPTTDLLEQQNSREMMELGGYYNHIDIDPVSICMYSNILHDLYVPMFYLVTFSPSAAAAH